MERCREDFLKTRHGHVWSQIKYLEKLNLYFFLNHAD